MGGVARVAAIGLVWVLGGCQAGKVSVDYVEIPLERQFNPKRYREVMQNLKMRQAHSLSLVDLSEIPLETEILTEKHIATYYGTIQIGGTAFRVLFDTGSCEFWVPSDACETARCTRHTRFPTHGAHFHTALAEPLNIQYLSGKVVGQMVHEMVRLGDVTVEGQIVGLADTVDIELLDDVVWDGILGLAYPNPSLTASGAVPLFDNIISKRILTDRGLANQFAYYIDDGRGAVTLGGANCDLIVEPDAPTSECIDRFQFVPVVEKAYWTIQISDVHVRYPDGSERSNICAPGGCKAIVDTGTYLVYGPQEQVNGMLSSTMSGCQQYTSMPEVTFDFAVAPGDAPVSVTLRPIDYILKFRVSGNDDCVVGISPDKDTIWTLGQVFLRSFYTLFDRDEDRVGFARIPRSNFVPLNRHGSASTAGARMVQLETASSRTARLNVTSTIPRAKRGVSDRKRATQRALRPSRVDRRAHAFVGGKLADFEIHRNRVPTMSLRYGVQELKREDAPKKQQYLSRDADTLLKVDEVKRDS